MKAIFLAITTFGILSAAPQQGRKADPDINGSIVNCQGGNCDQGRKADPDINGSIVNCQGGFCNQGRKAELRLKPCPYYAGHPKQYLCNYAPFTRTPYPAL